MAGEQRDYLAEEEEGGGGAGALASAPLTSSYLPSRSMTHFMYLIVKHWDLSEVTGRWGIPQETGRSNPAEPGPVFPSSLMLLWRGVRFALPGRSSGKTGSVAVHMRKPITQIHIDSWWAHPIKNRVIKTRRPNGSRTAYWSGRGTSVQGGSLGR